MGFFDQNNIYDVTPIVAEDLTYGQKSTNVLISNGTSISYEDLHYNGTQLTVAERVTIIKNFFNSQVDYDPTFVNILSDMVDHFVDGSGSDYTNNALTAAVQTHSRTQSYVNGVISILNNYISENDGNVSGLVYDENLWTQPTIRASQPFVQAMNTEISDNDADYLYLPSYGFNNGVPGLTLAIDGFYGNKIEIESFQASNGTYSGTINFTFYDHFGLDTPDLALEKYGTLTAGSFPGFRQWYILQHWNDLDAEVQPKPFVTLITFSVPFSGTY